MRRIPFLILAAWLASTGSRGEGALVSSSKTFGDQVINGFPIDSRAFNPANTPIYQRPFDAEGKLSAGVASASVTTDTIADTGVVDAIVLTPFSMTPSTKGASFSASITVVDVPANFPDPAVTHQVSGTWTENITISGVTGAAPTYVSSTPAPLVAFPMTPPFFGMSHNITFSAPNITLSGTYQVVGPVSTTSVPFTIEFEALPQQISEIAVRGGPGFGSGFVFRPTNLAVVYHAITPLIFDGLVDGMRFTASFAPDTAVRFASSAIIPEPASLAIALAGLAALVAGRRTGMTRRAG